jgi:hypothetical protein
MNQVRIRFVALVIVALSFSLLPVAQGSETDPFPGVALGAEIGTRQPVSPSTGNPLDGSPITTCPTGAG